MSAGPGQLLLCAGADVQKPEEPTGQWIERLRTCGCLEVGRWVETPAPRYRWWLKRTVRFCGAHMPRGKAGRE